MSYFCGQIDDNDRQLLILYDRGKRKLMEGNNRVVFRGQYMFLFFSLHHVPEFSLLII
jgi:hypothetical protein